MNPSPPDVQRISALHFFREANTSRRYYLSLAVNTRNIALVQGAAIIVTYGILLRNDLQPLLPFISIFGCLFTAVLASLHWNYLAYFEDCQDYLLELEENLGDKPMEQGGFCETIEESRNARVGSGWRRYFILYGSFLLLGVTNATMLGFSLYLVTATD